MANIISLRIDTTEQLFNNFDPAPFRERELDPQAERYILSNCEDLPLNQSVWLEIYIPADKLQLVDAQQLEQTIRHHFVTQTEDKAAELKKGLRLGRKGLLIGFLIFLVCTLTGLALMAAFPNSRFILTLEQSLVVFAWVLLWRPVEILTYDRWPLKNEYQQLKRLTQISVKIKPQAN